MPAVYGVPLWPIVATAALAGVIVALLRVFESRRLGLPAIDLEPLRRWPWQQLFRFSVLVAVLITALTVPAIILSRFHVAPVIPEKIFSDTKEINGWLVLLVVLAGIVSLVPYIFLTLVILLFFDSVFYVVKFNKPYLLVLLGRQYPAIETTVVESSEKAALGLQELYDLIASIEADASPLLTSRFESWSTDDYANAAAAFINAQLESIQGIFKRSDADEIRASIWRLDFEDNALAFLSGPELAPESRSAPLSIQKSIAGRSVRLTAGDALRIENIANARFDPDYQDRPVTKARYNAILTIPVLMQLDPPEARTVHAVLSIDSTLAQAFDENYIAGAKTIALTIGAVLQRYFDIYSLEEKNRTGS
jgi:hypothetical protein